MHKRLITKTNAHVRVYSSVEMWGKEMWSDTSSFTVVQHVWPLQWRDADGILLPCFSFHLSLQREEVTANRYRVALGDHLLSYDETFPSMITVLFKSFFITKMVLPSPGHQGSGSGLMIMAWIVCYIFMFQICQLKVNEILGWCVRQNS